MLIVLMYVLSTDLHAQSVGGNTTGATTYCTYTNSGFLGLAGHTGSVVNWQFSIDGGLSWNWVTPVNTLANQGYFNLTQTTCYRAVVQLTGWPADTSTVTCVTINQPTVPGTLSGGNSFCGTSGSGTLTLAGSIGTILNWQSSTDGGATWTSIANTTTTHSYSGVTQTTLYEVVVQNTGMCFVDTSTQASVVILAPSVSGSLAFSGNDTVCYYLNSGSINLSGNTGAVTGWLSSANGGLSWTPVTNTTTTQPYLGLINDTTYAAIVQNGTCPPDTTAALQLNVFPPPAPVNAGTDTTIMAGESVQLNGVGTGTPFWLPIAGLDNPVVYTPVASPGGTTSYTLVVTDANSCINTDTVLVIVNQPSFTGTASNYFSPNGDGVNDAWFIEDILYFPTNEVFVYNIYGQEVYSKKGYINDWKGTYNGSDLPDGTYYYVLKFSDSSTLLKGSVDILRKK
jgi:gliding motility-associated-like protein